MKAEHIPVLLDRVLDVLAPCLTAENAVFVDATLGLGGHTEAVLERFERCRVLGIDRDPEALARASDRLASFGDRFRAVHATYDRVGDALKQAGFGPAAGMLYDLGVSSMQLDFAERGFAYAQDAPLDMRMNPDDGLTAQIVVNEYDERELVRILRTYGEEKFAARIARGIVAARPLTSTSQLAEVVRESIPAAGKRTGGHPAKRTFQALRIEVNDELEVLRAALPAALGQLAVGGRLVVLAYQSLEDRIVKRELAAATTSAAPRGLPVVPEEYEPKFALVTRGAERASDAEIASNRRAKPVRMRVVERIAA